MVNYLSERHAFSELRWPDTVFQGQYVLSLSINCFGINNLRVEKIATIVVLDKDENLL